MTGTDLNTLFADAQTFDSATCGSADGSDRIFGENTDGMEVFFVDGRQVLAVNHEHVDRDITLLQRAKGARDGAADARKFQILQGVSVMEIARGGGDWRLEMDSPLNRRPSASRLVAASTRTPRGPSRQRVMP